MKDLASATPALGGTEWKQIGIAPDFENKLPMLNEEYPSMDSTKRNQPNDHHIFQDINGTWHLWACVRNTVVGRVLAHWTSESLTSAPWKLEDSVIRANRDAGESNVDWKGQEFLQSPFCVRDSDTWHMFYGGYAIGTDRDGNPTTDYSMMENQICVKSSKDGINWEEYRNKNGHSRVFYGPGAVRDQYVVKFDDLWYMYYCGHHEQDRKHAGIYVRTSRDLREWSEWEIAQYDDYDRSYTPESPVVIEKGGLYYLFRTHGPQRGTYVFVSDVPTDFGRGDLSGRELCILKTIAPEIVTDTDGSQYITTIRPMGEPNANSQPNGNYGTYIRPLIWS